MIHEQDDEMLGQMCLGDALRFASASKRLRTLAADRTSPIAQAVVVVAAGLDELNRQFKLHCDEYFHRLHETNGDH